MDVSDRLLKAYTHQTNHVHALSPERDHLRIEFPRVEGYKYRIRARIRVDWDRVPTLRVDPLRIPDEVTVKGLASQEGGPPSLMGPGRLD